VIVGICEDLAWQLVGSLHLLNQLLDLAVAGCKDLGKHQAAALAK